MAKFCTKCGKELKNGVCSKCDKETKVEKKTVTTTTNTISSIDFSGYANKYLDMLKGMFKKPIDTIKEYAKEEHLTINIIALVINAIVTGLFVYFLYKEAMATISGMFGFGMFGIGTIEVPFMKTFMQGFILIASWFATCAFALYVIANPIMKDKVNVKQLFSLVGVISTFTAITTVVATICIFMSINLALIILSLGALFYLTYLYQGIIELTSIEKNKLAYVFVPAGAVAMFVMLYVIPRIVF